MKQADTDIDTNLKFETDIDFLSTFARTIDYRIEIISPLKIAIAAALWSTPCDIAMPHNSEDHSPYLSVARQTETPVFTA